MPIYEFICMDCNHEFEELVLCNEEDISCPKCNGRNVKKQMSVCRAKWGSGGGSSGESSSSSIGGSCAGCSGGNCSTCGG